MADAPNTFEQEVHKNDLQQFLNALAQEPPQLDAHIEALEKQVWTETDCLACANCCRTMSPTYTTEDIKRISTHFRLSVRAFKEKWLYQNKLGALMNRSQPCQFLDLHTNKCTIYAIRPADCAGFPHLTKLTFVEHLHVHKQNIQYCPATVRLVEKLMHVAGEHADLKNPKE